MGVESGIRWKPRPESMAIDISGISAANAAGSSQQVQGPSQHKHGKHQKPSISDVDLRGSSVASGPSSTSKKGNKVDITA
jgi:hypothetical protein